MKTIPEPEPHDIISPLPAHQLVEVFDLIGTVLCRSGNLIVTEFTENPETPRENLGPSLEGISRALHSLRMVRDAFGHFNDMKSLRDITSAKYAADIILEELNAEKVS